MSVDVAQMLINLQRSYPGIIKLITSFSFVAGIALTLNALYKLKVYGEIRTMMGGQTDLKGPLLMLLVAGVFLFLPTAVDTIMMTTFGTTAFTPLSYISKEAVGFEAGMEAVLGLVQIVGLIAFIRGWLMIMKSSQQGQGGMGKGLIHVCGGIFAMNVSGTKEVIWSTFGFG